MWITVGSHTELKRKRDNLDKYFKWRICTTDWPTNKNDAKFTEEIDRMLQPWIIKNKKDEKPTEINKSAYRNQQINRSKMPSLYNVPPLRLCKEGAPKRKQYDEEQSHHKRMQN